MKLMIVVFGVLLAALVVANAGPNQRQKDDGIVISPANISLIATGACSTGVEITVRHKKIKLTDEDTKILNYACKLYGEKLME